ncbi:MAG: PilZ domain-containing protein [Planctomycetota bacterium]|nr:MAG: PilZ domain-containing protein [Planctomycetota bacterium]
MIDSDIPLPSLTLPKEQIERLLDSLDESSGKSGKHPQRRHPRLQFRSRNVIITIFNEQHTPEGIFSVCTRNLSLGGMSFLHSEFLETEKRMRIDIPTTEGEKLRLYSRVAHCRHIGGEVYEIGVQFLSIVEDDKIHTYASKLVGKSARMAS